MTTPALVPSTRVLKRDHLTLRAQYDDQIAQLRRDIDAEIASTVDARVAAAEVALRRSQQALHADALGRVARSIDAAVNALPHQLSVALDRIADDVVETAAVLAEWLCGAGGAASSAWTEGLVDRIGTALGQLTAHETATVRVNPADAVALAESSHPVIGGLDVRPDPSLAAGEAVVSTGSGDVDLTLGTALRRAIDIVTGRAAALTDHRDVT